jgi:hypothetical protein
VDIFHLPPTVSNISSAGTSGDVAIDYTLTGTYGLYDGAQIQVQYSVNGGPWQVATAAAGGDGTSGLAADVGGTAHTFLWDTAHDLGTTSNPSVQVRITPLDTDGVGDTQISSPFAVDNSGAVNALNIAFTDSGNDTVTLTQSGRTVGFNGSLAGGSLNLLGTATNLTSLTVAGGTGTNRIDASGVQMPVSLYGGAGSGADILIGGAGSDTLLYSGVGSSYDGGGGVDDTLIYPANAGDLIAFGGGSLLVEGQAKPIGSLTRIENFLASGAPAAMNNGTQFFLPIGGVPLTNAAINSISTASGSPTTVLTAGFTDANPHATSSSESAMIDWGDGTTSAGRIAISSSGNFTITASHIYATDASRIVVVTIVDSLGTGISVGSSYTGGLQLDGLGNLLNYDGTTPSTVDKGVDTTKLAPYFVDAQDPTPTVFDIHTDGGLWALAGSTPKQIDSGVQSILLGPDGTLFDLLTGGTLSFIPPGSSFSSQFIAPAVRTILADRQGNIYRLDSGGTLDVLPPGSSPSSTWPAAQPPGEKTTAVRSIALDSDGLSIDVMYTDGNSYRFDGTTWTFKQGPHLALSGPPGSTAGTSFPVMITVLDALGETVTGSPGPSIWLSPGARPPFRPITRSPQRTPANIVSI